MPAPDFAPFLIVAVDGGAASGKSSLARALARRFNFLHVDTGSHYRAVTLALIEEGVRPDDSAAVSAALGKIALGTHFEGHTARIMLAHHFPSAGGNITLKGRMPDAVMLRTPEVNANVSRFAALPIVRTFLFNYQRNQVDFARENSFAGLIMEGRDIGSVIFPDAPLRLFLTADSATRARRRAAEGQTDAVAERDRLDSARATAPLTCPSGATVIDSSNLTLDEVIARAAEYVETARVAVRADDVKVEFPTFYRLVWHVARAFMQVAGRAEAVGVENVPRTGAFLLASNHASFLDPLLAGCYLPRPICYFARKDLWNTKILAWALNRLKCIPVDRDGEGDIGAFKRVFAALKAGEGLQVFPEGTRTKDGALQPARRGIGLLAGKQGVPVVPVRVFGTFETFNRKQILPMPFYRIGVTYGRVLTPRDYDPGPGDPQRYEKISQCIMDAIAALPPPWAVDAKI
ncbi:MAG TPA: (d)CMP kinase [Opitutales bacterium]|nr:(d)CMP kinase [Opitutales bacterium]